MDTANKDMTYSIVSVNPNTGQVSYRKNLKLGPSWFRFFNPDLMVNHNSPWTRVYRGPLSDSEKLELENLLRTASHIAERIEEWEQERMAEKHMKVKQAIEQVERSLCYDNEKI